jgi:hypothetical protein
MRSWNRSMYFIVISIFLIQFSLNLTNFSVIAYSSYAYIGLMKTSVTIVFGALGSLSALLFSYLEFRKKKKDSYIRKNTYGLLLISASIVASISDFSSKIWLIAYMLMNTSFSRLIAAQLVEVGRVDLFNIEKNNKILQITSTFAVLIGVGLAPLIAINFPIKFVLVIATFCSILNLFLFNYFLSITHENEDSKINEVESFKNSDMFSFSESNLLIYYLIFSAWLLGGFFYVIEVPLLKERFSASPAEISYIFLLSIVSNIIFMIFFRVHKIKNKLHSVLLYTTVALLWLAPIYCFNQSRVAVPLIIILYGALNGVFNITYTTIIQQFSSKQERVNGLLFARFLTQFAILIGAAICYNFKTEDVYKIVFVIAFLLTLPLLLYKNN